MTTTSKIVSRPDVPDAVFDLLHVAFPDDAYDQRAFWPDDSVHALVYDGERLAGHAGFIVRTLRIGSRTIDAAYIEYVAAEPRRCGYGSEAMRALTAEIARRGFALAALGPATPEFYERLGWRMWRGPTAYRDRDGSIVPTPVEHPMVLDFGANVDLDAPIECDWRTNGDVW